MSKNKELVKARFSRFFEDPRVMKTHETMVDLIQGRASPGAVLEMILGFNMMAQLESECMYSDDSDSSDDDGPSCGGARGVKPHPQLKQLTEEEASKISQELMKDVKRNSKTEKNKRKKLRQRERKRLEKENVAKENPPEENKLESEEENKAEIGVNSSNLGTDNCNNSEAASPEGASNGHKKKKKKKSGDKTNTTEKEEKDFDSCKPQIASAKLEPEKESKSKKVQEKKKKKSEKENLNISKTPPDGPMKQDQSTLEKQNLDQKHLTQKSMELAFTGNRFASCEEFEMAIKFFTDAIKYNPKEFRLFGNRSLCYERIHDYDKALMDADVALCIKPNWDKGLFRKGKALCGLKRYYEASLIFKQLLEQESSNVQAAQELKRAQTLHLMEMGFSRGDCRVALKNHQTLEDAVEALFASRGSPTCSFVGSEDTSEEQDEEGEDEEEDEESEECCDEEWESVQRKNRSRTQNAVEFDPFSISAAQYSHPKSDAFSVWVGKLGPSMTYPKLHQLFSRVGTVCSIKMLLERQCAFVNYSSQDECEKAIHCISGMVVDGAPLMVRYPIKSNSVSSTFDNFSSETTKECFFWRTTGCTRDTCIFKHVPENKHIDIDKVTARLGSAGKF